MENKLNNAIEKSFLDLNVVANEDLVSKMLVNDKNSSEQVVFTIRNELETCNKFYISAAFLTNGGLHTILDSLRITEEKEIEGVIVISLYQYFSSPEALKKLSNFKNIKLLVTKNEEKVHTKGYIFFHDSYVTSIIGSSNLTEGALLSNKERNVKINSLENGYYIKDLLNEFEKLRDCAIDFNEEIYEWYKEVYKLNKINNERRIEVTEFVVPNSMQNEALLRIEESRKNGNDKALIISATGTGKTILSALDVKKFNPKRFLFIVHREKIINDAIKGYKRVLGKDIRIGKLTRDKNDYQYMFAMINTLAKEDVLNLFKKDEFDYIIIDEAHRIGGEMYQKILNYFEPKFLLGMTATPERSDGFNIYKAFNYNIPYEIRLNDAIETELICPFHYYGVKDISINGEVVSDQEIDVRNLSSNERVDNVIKNIEFYGYSGKRVKGLIFVSRNEEAKLLSDEFNKKGYRTVSLAGEDNEKVREAMVQRLEQDENNENALDYIFTVDIFNEGVDIPSINQVILLRPTESIIVFVQQLGRGLRKWKDKEFVVIVDFIGNYKKSFLIPSALSGDRTQNKDTDRRFIERPIVGGNSTISFTSDIKKEILKKIDEAKYQEKRVLKAAYVELKNKLGRIPEYSDFEIHNSIDPLLLVNKRKSYYSFLSECDKDYNVKLSEKAKNYIDFISSKYMNGKRPHELLFVKMILEGERDNLISKFINKFREKYPKIKIDENTFTSLINQFTQNYLSGSAAKAFEDCIFIEKKNDDYAVSSEFMKCFLDYNFVKLLREIIQFGLDRFNIKYSNSYKNTSFELYEKYTYEDVCRLLDWDKQQVALNIGGYKFDKLTNTYPVFINYEKADDIQATINYKDRFIDNNTLIAISKSGRDLNSNDITILKNAKENNTSVLLFVRKNKDDKESKEFYFLGKINPTGEYEEVIISETDSTAVEITYNLEDPIRNDIYNYLLSYGVN